MREESEKTKSPCTEVHLFSGRASFHMPSNIREGKTHNSTQEDAKKSAIN